MLNLAFEELLSLKNPFNKFYYPLKSFFPPLQTFIYFIFPEHRFNRFSEFDVIFFL